MDEVHQLTGKEYLLAPDSSIEAYANATVSPGTTNRPYHVLRYAPSHAEHLPYFIAHESGHLLRMYSAPEEARKVPSISNQHREQVRAEIEGHLNRLNRLGMPHQVLESLADFWHDGLVRQLFNIPADCRIERWMFENYEGLRPVQRRALRQTLSESYEVLKPRVAAITPRKLYQASNTMNAAHASYLSRILDDRRLDRPYRNTPYYRTGQELAESILKSPDQGYISDIDSSQEWAEQFGISDWFEWILPDEAELEIGH